MYRVLQSMGFRLATALQGVILVCHGVHLHCSMLHSQQGIRRPSKYVVCSGLFESFVLRALNIRDGSLVLIVTG